MNSTPGVLSRCLSTTHPAGAAGERLDAFRRTRRVSNSRDVVCNSIVQASALDARCKWTWDPATAGVRVMVAVRRSIYLLPLMSGQT